MVDLTWCKKIIPRALLLAANEKIGEFYTNVVISFNTFITCIIFAGATFSFVQESRIICVSRSLGILLARPFLTLSHSLWYIFCEKIKLDISILHTLSDYV